MFITRWLRVSVLSFVVASFASGTAFAADADQAKAQTLFANGERLYEEGRYEQAIAAFEEAYALSHEPALLYNEANAYERLGNLDKALEVLGKYRLYAPAEEQDVLLARCQTLERRIAAQETAIAAATAPIGGLSPASALPQPQPSLPPPVAEPVRRSPAPWVVAVGGGVVAAASGALAGGTWSAGQHDLEAGDQAGFEALRPLNNAAFGASLAGSAIGVGGVVWGVARGGSAGADRSVAAD